MSRRRIASRRRPAPCCCRRWGPSPRARSGRRPRRVSFEFFPPKTDEAEESLWDGDRAGWSR